MHRGLRRWRRQQQRRRFAAASSRLMVHGRRCSWTGGPASHLTGLMPTRGRPGPGTLEYRSHVRCSESIWEARSALAGVAAGAGAARATAGRVGGLAAVAQGLGASLPVSVRGAGRNGPPGANSYREQDLGLRAESARLVVGEAAAGPTLCPSTDPRGGSRLRPGRDGHHQCPHHHHQPPPPCQGGDSLTRAGSLLKR